MTVLMTYEEAAYADIEERLVQLAQRSEDDVVSLAFADLGSGAGRDQYDICPHISEKFMILILATPLDTTAL